MTGPDLLAHLEAKAARKLAAAAKKRRQQLRGGGVTHYKTARKHRRFLAVADEHRPALELQFGNHCGICGKAPSSGQRALAIDHDHKRMAVRGLLCGRCNKALPSWVTAPWLRAAADYLDKAEGEWKRRAST